MDVELLSRMIGELILDCDSLSLPGLGTFKAENMPAAFSDRGYTVNPPYRRLSFSGDGGDDGRLAAYLCKGGLAPDEAATVIRSFAKELGDELRSSRSVELPGLGRLRATRENHFFFVADESLDISPDSCGLIPVSLKTHAAAMPSLPEVPAAVATPDFLRTFKPVEESQEAPAKEAQAASAESSPKKAPRVRKRLSRGWSAAVWSAAAVVVFLAAFTAVSRLIPGSTDRLLYTPEQLEIINAPEDGTALPG